MKSLMTLAALLLAGPAFAHATFEETEFAQNSTAKFTARIGHGCEGEATLKVRVQIPEGVITVKPMPKAGWTLETVSGPYGTSYELWRSTVTEGVKEIVWTGDLPDAFYDEFVFRGRITDTLPAGETLFVPVVQECATKAERWIEIPAAGQDPDALEFPAPGLRSRRPSRATDGARRPPAGPGPASRPVRPGGAFAHAQLQSTSPAAGAVLEALPAEVTLTFSEPVAALVLRWIAPDGREAKVAGRSAGQTLAVTPPEALDRGTHLLSWRVVSTDGHPVGGTFAFAIGAPSEAPSRAPTPTRARPGSPPRPASP